MLALKKFLKEPFLKLQELYKLPPNLRVAFLLFFAFGFINVASYRLYLPYLRSLVICDTPLVQDEYSGSQHCGDKNLVISVALQQEAWLVGVKMIMRMISQPILGALSDQYGRKPILMLSIGGLTVAFLFQMLAGLQRFLPVLAIITIAMMVQGSTAAFGLCFKAMIADSLPEKEKGKGFVVFGQFDFWSGALATAFSIGIQKIQFVHYEWLCLLGFLTGLAQMIYCHLAVEESMLHNTPATAAKKAGKQSLLGLIAGRLSELMGPFKMLLENKFLRLRLLYVVLMQLNMGWVSVQDSFMISVLGYAPGDWDLATLPISGFQQLWALLMSGVMVQWTADPENRYWYMKASLTFSTALAVLECFAPFGAIFMLTPKYLAAILPGDGGADAAFFSSQVPAGAQASANGLMMVADNLMSGVTRGLYARLFFDPSARGWTATCPLWIRTAFLLSANIVYLYSWSKYSRGDDKKNE